MNHFVVTKPESEEENKKKEEEEPEDSGKVAKKKMRSNFETHARDDHKGKNYKPDSGSDATLAEESGDKSDEEGVPCKEDRDFIYEEEEEEAWKDKDQEMISPGEESQDDDLCDYVDKDVEELDWQTHQNK